MEASLVQSEYDVNRYQDSPKVHHCRLNVGDYGQVSDEVRKEEWQFQGLTKILKHDILFLKSKNSFHSAKTMANMDWPVFPILEKRGNEQGRSVGTYRTDGCGGHHASQEL
jgi:hypothetical protein